MDAPFWITASFAAMDELGSKSVSNACAMALESVDVVVVVVVEPGVVVGVEPGVVVGMGGAVGGVVGGTVPVVALVAITGEMGEPAGAEETMPVDAASLA